MILLGDKMIYLLSLELTKAFKEKKYLNELE